MLTQDSAASITRFFATTAQERKPPSHKSTPVRPQADPDSRDQVDQITGPAAVRVHSTDARPLPADRSLSITIGRPSTDLPLHTAASMSPTSEPSNSPEPPSHDATPPATLPAMKERVLKVPEESGGYGVDERTRKVLESVGYDEAVFCALPPDVRHEVLAQVQHKFQQLSQNPGGAGAKHGIPSVRQASPAGSGGGKRKGGGRGGKRKAEGNGKGQGAMEMYLKRAR